MDREPAGGELLLFTSTEAGNLHPDLYLIDVPVAQRYGRRGLAFLERWSELLGGVE